MSTKDTIRKLTIKYDVKPRFEAEAFPRSKWYELVVAAHRLEIPTGKEHSPWMGAYDFVSRHEVENARSAIFSHIKRSDSRSQGWIFQTQMELDEAEGVFILYIRKVLYKGRKKMLVDER